MKTKVQTLKQIIDQEKRERLERLLYDQIRVSGLVLPEKQINGIVPGRKFRWDFGYRFLKILIEVQGGIYMKGKKGPGAHNRAWGIIRDCEKNNLAVLAGWRVLYFDTQSIRTGKALRFLEKMIPAYSPNLLTEETRRT